MVYMQVDSDGRIIAIMNAETNPDEVIWVEAPWSEAPDDFDDYKLVDGELIHDARDLPPVPFSADQVLSALFQDTEVLDALPDSALEHMAPYMQEWADGIDYSAGDKVQWEDRPYRCLQGHTSIETWTPSDSPSLWARIIAGIPDEPLPWEQPDSTNPYMKGDKVTHNGHTWESDVDNNVWEPGVYGWTQID